MIISGGRKYDSHVTYRGSPPPNRSHLVGQLNMFHYAEMFYKMYYSRRSSHGGKIISGTCPNAPSGPFSLLRQQSCPQTPTLPRNLVFLKYKYSPMSYEQRQIQKCWNKQHHLKYLLKNAFIAMCIFAINISITDINICSTYITVTCL